MFHPIEALWWWQTRFNRPAHLRSESAIWSLFAESGVALNGAPDSLQRAAQTPTDLLIALTTYHRPEAARQLLTQITTLIQAADRPLRVHVLVLHDASNADYAEVEASARTQLGAQLTWLSARHRLGKPNFWQTYQAIFLVAQQLLPTHALCLQDDLELPQTFMKDIYARWEATAHDPLRRVIYLCAADDDEPNGRWVRFRRVDNAAVGVRLTQWFDLQAFFVDRAFFELLQYRMIPVHPNRFRRQPSISSGVGRQLTLRLRTRANIYQAFPTLVFHGAHPSQMNPEARTQRNFDNHPKP